METVRSACINGKRGLRGKGALALLLILFAAGPASAYYTFRRFIPLHDVRNTGASGEVLIEPYGSFMPGERAFSVDAYHLRPDSVYTVWLVNEGTPNAGAERYFLGVGTNSFRTDGAGNGRYVTTANEYDLERWRFVEVNYHPDNNPGNTKEMETVLKGDLVYGYHS